MKVQLINLGQSNINKTIEVADVNALRNEIQQHIVSKNWYIENADEQDLYVVFSGFRVLGEVMFLPEENATPEAER